MSYTLQIENANPPSSREIVVQGERILIISNHVANYKKWRRGGIVLLWSNNDVKNGKVSKIPSDVGTVIITKQVDHCVSEKIDVMCTGVPVYRVPGLHSPGWIKQQLSKMLRVQKPSLPQRYVPPKVDPEQVASLIKSRIVANMDLVRDRRAILAACHRQFPGVAIKDIVVVYDQVCARRTVPLPSVQPSSASVIVGVEQEPLPSPVSVGEPMTFDSPPPLTAVPQLPPPQKEENRDVPVPQEYQVVETRVSTGPWIPELDGQSGLIMPLKLVPEDVLAWVPKPLILRELPLPQASEIKLSPIEELVSRLRAEELFRRERVKRAHDRIRRLELFAFQEEQAAAAIKSLISAYHCAQQHEGKG